MQLIVQTRRTFIAIVALVECGKRKCFSVAVAVNGFTRNALKFGREIYCCMATLSSSFAARYVSHPKVFTNNSNYTLFLDLQ